MKRLVSILVIASFLLPFTIEAFGADLVTFGPKTYALIKSTTIFNQPIRIFNFRDSFTTFPGPGTLTIQNGSDSNTNRVHSVAIECNGKKVFSNILPPGKTTTILALEEVNNLSILLIGTTGSFIRLTVTQTIPVPTVSISAEPLSIEEGASSILSWSSTNSDYCILEPGIGTVATSGSYEVSPTETTTYIISTAGRGGTSSASVTVDVTRPVYDPPTVDLTPSSATITKGESITLSWLTIGPESAYMDNGIGTVPVNGSLTVTPTHTTTYTLTVSGETGSASATALITVQGTPEPPPEGSFGEQYKDLVPTDATLTQYDTRRFAIITGLVRSLDELPLPDFAVTVHGHPEYGTALTDTEGRFSIPVEGGSAVTVEYRREGFITAQRPCYVPWSDIAVIETVTMIEEDIESTMVTFDGNPATVTVHESTLVEDESGERSCSVVFTGDNRAILMGDDGKDAHELSVINVRATEFTTDASMPAKLPPTSAYTYCVELNVDGVERVRFEKPVTIWVDNFLGFSVGEVVPVGYYDRDRGVWAPSDNGVVVKLLDTDADGIVDALDANADGNPDDLNSSGAFSEEVAGLQNPDRYPPNATFWRVEISHFTPWDFNWPYGPPLDAIGPNPEGVSEVDQQKKNERDCVSEISSSVEERSRIFHEDIPIPGTDMTLHYASNRVNGYITEITVPVSGETVPASLKRIDVSLTVAGRTFPQTVEPMPMQSVTFEWDGCDYLGIPVDGIINAHVEIGYVYNLVYFSPRRNTSRSFGQTGSGSNGVAGRTEFVWRKLNNVVVDTTMRSDKPVIADGWSVSTHHRINPGDRSTLHRGDGTVAANKILLTTRVHNLGRICPSSVIKDARGNTYVASSCNDYILKIDTNGKQSYAAGYCCYGPLGDGGPAVKARLDNPNHVAFDNSGNMYIAESGGDRIRKVDSAGIIWTIAGNGTEGYSGDGGPAANAKLKGPHGMALDPEGNLYFADMSNNRIRKIDTTGIITTVAGNGTGGYGGDGGPAIMASIFHPRDIAIDRLGNLFIADTQNERIRKVNTAGIISTVAGNGTYAFSGDGGPAVDAAIYYPMAIALDDEGNLYIADRMNNRIRKVDSRGIINTIAGNGIFDDEGDGGPASVASFGWPEDLYIDPTGTLYALQVSGNCVRKVESLSLTLPGAEAGDISFVEDNGIGHIMSPSGMHKRTIDTASGITLYSFGYDDENNLVSITDRFGNVTEIQRDGSGSPMAIVSPDGLTTTLTIDSNNHLTMITCPDGASYHFEYSTDGLLTAKTEPEGNRYEHAFNEKGRLTDATDNEGGHWNYARITYPNGDIESTVVSREGNITTYLDHTDSTGAYTSTITDPTGGTTLFTSSADGLSITKSLPCGMELAFTNTVDPEYKYEYVQSMEETSPAGLKEAISRNRTYQDSDGDKIPDLITETATVNGKAATFEHDVFLSQKTLRTPEGRTMGYVYDPATLLVNQSYVQGLNSSSFTYDTRGRLTSVETGTRRSTYTYDSRGFVASVTDPKQHTTTYEHDPVGRITALHGPDGRSVEFTYDGNGNMTTLTTPSDADHVFIYNGVNRNNAYQTPLSGGYSHVYDTDRRLIQTTFPSGARIEYLYDTVRLSRIQTPEGTIDYSYLCGTKVGSIANGIETISYDYDGTLVTSETLTGTLAATMSYTYNNDFNITDATYAGGTESFAYDNDGLLTGSGRFEISRNAENGLPESVSDGTFILARTFNGYGEAAGELCTIAAQSPLSWNVDRNDTGRITDKTETVGGATSAYSYTYDSAGRLLTVTKDGILAEEYRYGSSGARTFEMVSARGIAGSTYTYSAEDHLLTAGDATYQYDADGFLAARTTGEGITSYDYSTRGELLKVILPDGTIISYLHDPLGRRIAKKINGAITEKYLWQGLTTLFAVYDGSGTLLMRFEYADGRMPYAMTKGGSTYYLTYDQTGSLKTVTDASGNLVKQVGYDSFGNVITDTNPDFEVPFGFAGGLFDPDTGLIRFGYRDYDPDTGRWTAKDPILFAGGDTDLYGYCVNDPVSLIDSSGLDVYRGHRAKKGYKERHGVLHHDFLYIVNPKLPEGKAYYGFTGSFMFSSGQIAINDNWDINHTRHDGYLEEIKNINEDTLIQNISADIEDPPFYLIIGNNCQDWADKHIERAMKQQQNEACK